MTAFFLCYTNCIYLHFCPFAARCPEKFRKRSIGYGSFTASPCRIDAVDAEMAALFERRMQAVADVVRYKAETGKPVFDAAREADVITRNTARLQNEELRPITRRFAGGHGRFPRLPAGHSGPRHRRLSGRGGRMEPHCPAADVSLCPGHCLCHLARGV
ncbi:MAG: hypothetical protein EP147_01475 [Subdoligranulum sp.]|nr:hypothetical protein [Subdoligranulum sp.]